RPERAGLLGAGRAAGLAGGPPPRAGGGGAEPAEPPPPRAGEHEPGGGAEIVLRRRPVALVRVVLALLLASALAAQVAAPALETPRRSEYEVKAAYLYNFAKFVKWPQEPQRGTFVIAVLGQDPFGQVLDRTFEGKQVLDRKVEIRRLDGPPGPNEAQMLFVSGSERPRLEQHLRSLEGASVLAVGALGGLGEHGGMIALRVGNDVVQFEINLDQVERAKLKMSSQLIRLARNVIGKGGGL